MIKDCQNIFESVNVHKGNRMIIDNYIPKDGTYFLHCISGEKVVESQPVEVKFDKKNNELICSDITKLDLIKILDYNSKLIEMNKPIDPKKTIHSNNFLTIAVKKESLKDKKLTLKIINSYFNVLRNPEIKYKGKSKSITLYKETENTLSPIDDRIINIVEKWVIENYENISIDLDKKDYLKIFFVLGNEEETKSLYEQENKRYVLPNIFNCNDYNITVNDEILGLPKDNMGMNAKKPFLELKKRGNISVPYLLSTSDALKQSEFFEYLMGLVSAGYYNVYFDEENNEIHPMRGNKKPNKNFRGYFLRLKKEKNEVSIQHFEPLTSYSPELRRKFVYKKFFYDSDENNDRTIRDIDEMEMLLNEVLFSKYLVNNYFTEVKDLSVSNQTLKKNILIGRGQLFSWIHMRGQRNIEPLISRIADSMICDAIKNGYIIKARKIMNLKWSFIDYSREENLMEEKMKGSKELFKEHIKSKEPWEYSGDDEYYFAVGQIMGYFLFKSKAGKKPMAKVNQIINAKSDEKVKNILINEFQRYNYDIDYGFKKFKDVFGKVMEYKPTGKVVKEMILSGYMDENVFLMRKEEEK